MRTIKFRGKQLENIRETDKTYASEKGTWRYGTYKYIHKFYDGVNAYMICDIYGREVMCDKETIGQFTGLHDKNGVEIWEGDVLCYKDENYEDGIIGWEVFYEDGSFMASLTDGKDTFGGDFQLQEYAISDKLYCEVIGNIHEEEMK